MKSENVHKVLSNLTQKDINRFWEKVKISNNQECWNWLACLDKDGYGYLRVNYKNLKAHIISYTIENKHPPIIGVIRHTCDNRKCCNPKHLIDGTNIDNIQDRDTKGRQIKGIGINTVKISDLDVPIIRELYLKGYTLIHIASMYDVSFSTIHRIVTRKSWKHI